MIPCATLLNTSGMIHYFGVSLNKQHTAGLLICRGVQGGRQRTREGEKNNTVMYAVKVPVVFCFQ